MSTPIILILTAPDYSSGIMRASALLNTGGLVVLPTDTVYGTFALLTNNAATSRLRALRNIADKKPLTIHLASPDQAGQFLGPLSDLARRMVTKLWPGPVSLSFDVASERRQQVANTFGVLESAIYENGNIVLRCPDHAVATEVLLHVSGPVVAISAGVNASELDGKVDLILDAGPPRYPKPSTLIKINSDSYQILRKGLYDERMIEKLLHTTILFICSGNTCRSAMSEAIARDLIAKKLNVPEDALASKGITVLSAGAMASPGSRATPAGVNALRDLGIDLSKHRSRALSVELIHQADVIFTMGRSHRQAVLSLVPGAADKTIPLDPAGDVEDPFGAEKSLYRQLAITLRQLIESRLRERSLL